MLCMTVAFLYSSAAHDLDGGGVWVPAVVGGPMRGYKMFR